MKIPPLQGLRSRFNNASLGSEPYSGHPPPPYPDRDTTIRIRKFSDAPAHCRRHDDVGAIGGACVRHFIEQSRDSADQYRRKPLVLREKSSSRSVPLRN
jgi:hypothetical protein